MKTLLLLLSCLEVSHSILVNCTTSPCELCPSIEGRVEVRSLSAAHRAQVATAFRRARHAHNRTEWATMLWPSRLCELVQYLDDRLSPYSIRLPYWDSRIEQRMPRPSESVIFQDYLFPQIKDNKQRRRRERGRRHREQTRSRKLRASRRGLPRLLSHAVRSSKNSQLLTVLNRIGLVLRSQISDSCSAQCATTSPFLFCDHAHDKCASRVRPGSSCSRYASSPVCYDSLCLDGVCSVPTTSSARPSSQARTVTIPVSRTPLPSKKKRDRAARKQLTIISLPTMTPTTDSAIEDEVEADQIITGNISARSVDDIVQLLEGSGIEPIEYENKTTSQKGSEDGVDQVTMTAARNFYDISAGPVSTITPSVELTTTDSLLSTAFRDTRIYKVPIVQRPPQTNILPFNASLPFPSAYFAITVIQGAYHRKDRILRRANGAIVSSRGANLPNGYTQSVAGLLTDSASYIIRVPDPTTHGPIVELTLAVERNGSNCSQLCKHGQAQYKTCEGTPIRLSRFPEYSDPIKWNQNVDETIAHLWTGAGYYKKYTRQHILFTCELVV